MAQDLIYGQPAGGLGGAGLGLVVCAYAEPELDRSPVVEKLSAQGVHVYRDWPNFRSNGFEGAEAAICAIVALQGPVWRGLVRVRARRSSLALMMITNHTRANTRALARMELDELLFLDEISDDALSAAIAGLARQTTTRIAAAALRENTIGLDAELAETLARACASQRPVQSVPELARIMGYARSVLTRRWEECISTGSKPHHFLEWLLCGGGN